MKTYNLTIAAPHGLHIRVAARIVELVKRSGSKVRLFGPNNREADGESIISLLCMDAADGNLLRVEVEGGNEWEVAENLAEIFAGNAAA